MTLSRERGCFGGGIVVAEFKQRRKEEREEKVIRHRSFVVLSLGGNALRNHRLNACRHLSSPVVKPLKATEEMPFSDGRRACPRLL